MSAVVALRSTPLPRRMVRVAPLLVHSLQRMARILSSRHGPCSRAELRVSLSVCYKSDLHDTNSIRASSCIPPSCIHNRVLGTEETCELVAFGDGIVITQPLAVAVACTALLCARFLSCRGATSLSR